MAASTDTPIAMVVGWLEGDRHGPLALGKTIGGGAKAGNDNLGYYDFA
jgi:hypothetical protein